MLSGMPSLNSVPSNYVWRLKHTNIQEHKKKVHPSKEKKNKKKKIEKGFLHVVPCRNPSNANAAVHSFLLSLYTKNKLHAFVSVKAHRCQRHHLDVSDCEADEETSDSSLPEDHGRCLSDSKSSTVTNSTSNLHAPPDHFERV